MSWSLYALLKVFKMIFPQKLFDYDCITLYIRRRFPGSNHLLVVARRSQVGSGVNIFPKYDIFAPAPTSKKYIFPSLPPYIRAFSEQAIIFPPQQANNSWGERGGGGKMKWFKWRSFIVFGWRGCGGAMATHWKIKNKRNLKLNQFTIIPTSLLNFNTRWPTVQYTYRENLI